MHKDDSNGEVNTERLAIGKEVEVAPTESPPCFNLQRKCPSLDDVFKGERVHCLTKYAYPGCACAAYIVYAQHTHGTYMSFAHNKVYLCHCVCP